MPPLVLASSSRYRRDLLARIVDEFKTLSPQLDETVRAGEQPQEAVMRIADEKALAAARLRPKALILAGDQLASLAGRPLGKPVTMEEAVAQLEAMSGRTVTYCTAIAVLSPQEKLLTHLDLSHVTLRRLNAAEIQRYLAREQPLDCAGALRLERSGIALCKSIETADSTALIGLPLIATARILRACGLAIP